MPAPSFVHLRLHSEYSIVDGTLRIDEAIAAAAADAMPALALTDLSNAFGLVKFYRAARARGMKPIAGCDVWLTHESRARRAVSRAAARARTARAICGCATGCRARIARNQHRGRAELRREWFDEGTDGLIALSGARDGDVGDALLQGNAEARESSRRAIGRRGSRSATTSRCSARAVPTTTRSWPRPSALAGELALPVVATHPVQFLQREDFRAHEARVCIAEGHILADTRRPRRFTAEQYFTTQAEMAARFADLPEALANSVAIAQRCNLTIPLGKNHLPEFPDARRASRSTSTCATRRAAGLEAAPGATVSRRRAARAQARRVRGAPRVRDRAPSCRWASPATS